MRVLRGWEVGYCGGWGRLVMGGYGVFQWFVSLGSVSIFTIDSLRGGFNVVLLTRLDFGVIGPSSVLDGMTM